MFAKRSYLLKSNSKLLDDGSQHKSASNTTPRTIPSVENVRSFGWKPASYDKDTSAVAEKRGTKGKRDSSSAGVKIQGKPQKSTADVKPAAPLRSNVSTRSSQDISSKPARSQPVPVPNARSNFARAVPSKAISKPSNRSPASSDHPSLKTKHDSNSTPPAVAALLAMTSIRKPSSFPKGPKPAKEDGAQKKVSVQELMDEWRLEELSPDHNSLHESCSPNLELLLSPPTDDEEEDRMLAGSRSIKDEIHSGRLRERSASSDSIPSLSTDDDASLSFSVISSPSSSIYNRHHPASERRERYSSPKSVDAASDHPLIPSAEPEPEHFPLVYKKRKPSRAKQTPSQPRASSLKSNLTASLAALRSAARSVSNFAGPSVLPDNHLTSNFFTVPYQPERRPKPIEGVPTPELRRYLNPSGGPAARTAERGCAGGPMYDFHIHGSQVDHTDLEAVAAAAAAAASIYPALPATDINSLSQSTYPHYTTNSGGQPITAIRLQTYSRKKTKSSRRSSHGGDDAIVPIEASPLQNQRAREPRENSDFLRICVLEMRMRRAGKLEPGVPGRAKMWLPPRMPFAAGNSNDLGIDERLQRNKKRWEGISVQY